MSTPDRTPDYRELYEEFPDGSETIAMISDPSNPHAWIQSDVTQDIEP